jgi:bacillopeptidase F
VPAPDAYRLKQARGLDGRRRGIPLPTRILLVAAVALLGAVTFLTVSGGIGSLVGALGSSFSGLVGRVTSTPVPSATDVVVADAPVIASPTEPYTNQTSVDLELTIPAAYVGERTALIRIYLTLEGQAPAVIAEVPPAATVHLIVPVELTAGRNDFSATIVKGSVESDHSPVVTFILDADPPVITLTSPKDGETVNGTTVTLTGTTQPRTALLARNEANGGSISGQAGSDGTFSLDLPLDPGPNGIRITGTDPAGNPGELILSVVGGSGKLSATLTASAYQVKVAALPVSLQMSVLVTDPDGHPLEGAAVTFNLTVPGIPPIARDVVTGGDGRATFTTTLPAGVTAGAGLATVIVATAEFGTVSAQKTITIVPEASPSP